MDRRSVVSMLGATAAGALFTGRIGAAGPPGAQRIDRVGIGLFSIPGLLGEDFAGALGLLAQIGYKEVEFFGPYAFSVPEAKERWAAVTAPLDLAGSGYYGHTPEQVREILDRNGLTSPSMHTDLLTLRTRMDELAEAAHVVGHRWVILPAIPDEHRTDLDAYKRIAEEFNDIGASARRNGLRFAYHNHGYGLAEMEGEVPLDVLLERTDPGLVDLEMDLYWTVAGGADPIAYLDAHAGRYRLIHIKDMTKEIRFSGDGSTAEQWFELFPFMTDAGAGVLDLPHILSHAKASGVQHFLVERDLVANPEEALPASYEYLAGLELKG